jgi:hypothetical protein
MQRPGKPRLILYPCPQVRRAVLAICSPPSPCLVHIRPIPKQRFTLAHPQRLRQHGRFTVFGPELGESPGGHTGPGPPLAPARSAPSAPSVEPIRPAPRAIA